MLVGSPQDKTTLRMALLSQDLHTRRTVIIKLVTAVAVTKRTKWSS